MKSIVEKAYGKINIALNILGVKNNYHLLDTLVCTINIYDKIKIKKRKDNNININFIGKYKDENLTKENSNAYRAAKLFMNTYNTSGFNIEIERNIPCSSGLGSSSADISGVLSGLNKLFIINDNVKALADLLGSDSGYLLTGGFARLKGRGEIIEKLKLKRKLYFIIILSDNGVKTVDSFLKFDEMNINGISSNIDKCIEAILSEDIDLLSSNIGNSLLESSKQLNQEIENNIFELSKLSPPFISMSGSGSSIFTLYFNYVEASWAYDKLYNIYGKKVKLVESIEF